MTTPAAHAGQEALSGRPQAFRPGQNTDNLAFLQPASNDDITLDDEAYWSKICERATD